MFNATIVVTKKTDIWDELRRIDASAAKDGLDPVQKSSMMRAVESELRSVVTASREIFERGIAVKIERVAQSETYCVKIALSSGKIDMLGGIKKIFQG